MKTIRKTLKKAIIIAVTGLALLSIGISPAKAQQTPNFIPKFNFNVPPSIINSIIYDNGNFIGIGTTAPNARLDIQSVDLYQNEFMITRNMTSNPLCPTCPIYPYIHVKDFSTSLNTTNTRFILNWDGNMGLGTATPKAPLEVLSGTTYNKVIASFGTNETGLTKERNIYFINRLNTSGYNNISLQNDQGIFWTDGNGTTASPNAYNTTSGFVIAPFANAKSGLRIGADGRVGIGTNAPLGLLHVNNESGTEPAMLLVGKFDFDVTKKHGAIKSAGSDAGFFFANRDLNGITGSGSAGDWYAWVAGGGRAALQTPGDPSIIVVRPDGNVGIGIIDPSQKLVVNGMVCAQEIRVSMLSDPCSAWPDYVFAPDYNLMSLSDLDTYIKQNKHLPGVPSSEEVAKNGIEMGMMQAKTMEKVEELTLYLLEMKKENEMLKQRLEVLESCSKK